MADQKFPYAIRDAVWTIYGEKCFYCKRKVKFRDFEIDHLIPESLLAKPDELAKALVNYGLPTTFDLQAHENLAPSCSNCNGDKGDQLLPVGMVAILLARINSKLPSLDAELKKKKAEKTVDQVIKTVSGGIEKGTFSISDFIDGLAKSGLIEVHNGVVSVPKRPGVVGVVNAGSNLRVKFLSTVNLQTLKYDPSIRGFLSQILTDAFPRSLTKAPGYRNIYFGLTKGGSRIVVLKEDFEIVLLAAQKKTFVQYSS